MNGKVKSLKSGSPKMKNSPLVSKLAALIRTLTSAQKRDFKKYVKFWGEQSERRYVTLFDAVQHFIAEGGKEEELTDYLLKRKKLGKTPGDLSNDAKYLYRKILESMRTTPDGAPHFNRLNALMQDIIFLFNKNLYDDCRALIEEALALAHELDKPAYEIELNLWKSRLTAWKLEGETVAGLAEWRQNQEKLVADLNAIVASYAMAAEIQTYMGKKIALPESLDSQSLHLWQQHEDGALDALSHRAKLHAFNCLSNYFDLKQALGKGTSGGLVKKALLEKSLSFQKKSLDLFHASKIFAEEEQLYFMSAVNGCINRSLRLGRPDLAEQLEAEITHAKNELPRYQFIAYQRLQFHLARNEFRQAREYFEKNEVAVGIEKFKNRIPENRLLALRFTVGQVYYALDDFDCAGDWFGKVGEMRPEVRPDVVVLCKVLEILCLWEYGAYMKDDDLGRPVKNLRRSLRRAGLADDFLEKVLDAVETIFRHARALTKAGLPELMAEIKTDMEKDPSKYLYGLVFAWFEARLHRSTVSKEILKFDYK